MADYLNTSFAKEHVLQCAERLQNVLHNIELSNDQHVENEQHIQEEWMILSDYHNSNSHFKICLVYRQYCIFVKVLV